MEHVKLNVQGMSCGHCKAAIEGALKEVGAKEIVVHLEEGTVEVGFEAAVVGLDQIKEAIEDAGYDVVA